MRGPGQLPAREGRVIELRDTPRLGAGLLYRGSMTLPAAFGWRGPLPVVQHSDRGEGRLPFVTKASGMSSMGELSDWVSAGSGVVVSDSSIQSDLLGLVLGLTPGIVLGVIGLVLGGEWAWNLGFVAILLILFGMFAGPLLGWVGPEISVERPAVFGAVLGSVPGIVFAVLRFSETGWLAVLAVLVGAVFGTFAGHWFFKRSAPDPMPQRLERQLF